MSPLLHLILKLSVYSIELLFMLTFHFHQQHVTLTHDLSLSHIRTDICSMIIITYFLRFVQ